MTPLEQLKTSETRKKKITIIVIGTLGALYLLPNPVTLVRRAVYQRQLAAAATQAREAQPAPSTPTIAQTEGVALAGRIMSHEQLMGNWVGAGSLIDQPYCNLSLEVHAADGKEATFAGFAALSCLPTVLTGAPMMKGVDAIGRASGLNPAAAMLLGEPKDDAIVFRVKVTVGVQAATRPCAMESASIRPFGPGAAFKWTEKGCSGGELILHRK